MGRYKADVWLITYYISAETRDEAIGKVMKRLHYQYPCVQGVKKIELVEDD